MATTVRVRILTIRVPEFVEDGDGVGGGGGEPPRTVRSSTTRPPTYWPGGVSFGTVNRNGTSSLCPGTSVSLPAPAVIHVPTWSRGSPPSKYTMPLVCPVVASTG